jgi:hypothetical protein
VSAIYAHKLGREKPIRSGRTSRNLIHSSRIIGRGMDGAVIFVDNLTVWATLFVELL